YPSERPIVVVSGGLGRVEVHRNIPMRGGQWLGEFVGSARVEQPDALRQCIGFALTGTSRLAIASVETPHPAFALGMIAYLPRAERSVHDRARALEARLRANLPIDQPIDEFPAVVR